MHVVEMDWNAIICTIAWMLLLLFITWPLAFFCVTWYIWWMPLESLVLVLFRTDVVYTVNDFLERFVLWPRLVGKAIAEGSSSFPTPANEGSLGEHYVSSAGFECKRILYSIVWLLLLIFISMPLSFFLSWWWLLLMPFECMIRVVGDIDVMLAALVTWPRRLMKATLEQYTNFSSPFDDRTGYQPIA